MRHVTDSERRIRLGVNHYLVAASTSIERVAGALVGIHSSDPATVFLAARARVVGLTVPKIEEALYDRRTVLRLHGMRRTMFVAPPDLAAVMDAACTQAYLPGQSSRIATLVEKEGLADDGERWLHHVMDETEAALARLGPSVASELTDAVPRLATKIHYGGGTFGMSTRVLFLLAAAGRVVRGRPRDRWIASQYRWVRTEDWITPLRSWDPAQARAELLRRWLAGYGPGTMTDLQWWSGWSKTLTIAALADVGAHEVALDDGTGFVHPDDPGPPDDAGPRAALLPGLDPTPMGWKDRAWFNGTFPGPHYDRNGNIGPTIWSNGRIVGAWATGDGGDVRIRLDHEVSSDDADRIESERTNLEAWLAGTRITPRFRTPIEKDLSA